MFGKKVYYCRAVDAECVYKVADKCTYKEHLESDVMLSRPGCDNPAEFMRKAKTDAKWKMFFCSLIGSKQK